MRKSTLDQEDNNSASTSETTQMKALITYNITIHTMKGYIGLC